MEAWPYQQAAAEDWDAFCDQCLNATLLHTRGYLGYHGDRFVDESVILGDAKGRWLGLFPAARDMEDGRCVVSHPGITYGGVLHAGRLAGGRMLEVFNILVHHYRECGYERMTYKAIPHIYHRAPAQDDLYALFRLGARRFRCDLSSSISLRNRLRKSERRRRALRKAEKAGIAIHTGSEFIEPLWQTLRDNLARKHHTRPVHSEIEIRLLAERFPERIRFVTGWVNDELAAGVVVFVAGPAHHAQYIASSEAGHEVCALDAVFEACIADAEKDGADWFDFGISNEAQGQYLNDGLFSFKNEFGGGGIVHEFYEVRLAGNGR